MKKELREEQHETSEEKKLHRQDVATDEQRIRAELVEAKRKATMILAESEKIAKDLIFDLEKTLGRRGGEVTEFVLPQEPHFEEELMNLSGQIKTQYVKRIKSMLTALERYEVKTAHKIEAFADEQEALTDQNLQKIRVEQLQKIHQKIEEYKVAEINQFNSKVQKLIDQAAIEVLGKALSSGEQEELILQALEKIKNNNTT